MINSHSDPWKFEWLARCEPEKPIKKFFQLNWQRSICKYLSVEKWRKKINIALHSAKLGSQSVEWLLQPATNRVKLTYIGVCNASFGKCCYALKFLFFRTFLFYFHNSVIVLLKLNWLPFWFTPSVRRICSMQTHFPTIHCLPPHLSRFAFALLSSKTLLVGCWQDISNLSVCAPSIAPQKGYPRTHFDL